VWSFPLKEVAATEGRIELTDQYSVNQGGHALLFDSTKTSGDMEKDLNEAILSIDLSGKANPILTFHQLEGEFGTQYDDESHELGDVHTVGPGSERPYEAEGDGLSISNDGTTWYRVFDIQRSAEAGIERNTINRTGDGLWWLHEYDLAAEVSRINDSLGEDRLSLGPNFMIKFSQYDEARFPFDGWAIDKVQITDSPQYFDPSLERNVFHRLNLPSEDQDDFLYRVAQFGVVDENTPIVVSVHGTHRLYRRHTTDWQAYVNDPANGVEDLIVVAPWFVEGAKYHNYNRLAWGDHVQAEQVLLEVISAITSRGVGDPAQLKLFGFSRGGAFVERFTWAHPERVSAVVVGAPGTHTFPDPHVFYHYGIGRSASKPLPEGIDLNIADFVSNRIMFWVGAEEVPEPEHARFPNIQEQGVSKLHRILNMFESVERNAAELAVATSKHEVELFIEKGEGHDVDPPDMATFYEFLFRPFNPLDKPVLVHPRVVRTPTLHDSVATLPLGLDRVAPSSDFYLELWVEAPAATGVETGKVDIFYDTDLVDAVGGGLEHGSVFDQEVSGTIDEQAGWILGFGGQTDVADAAVGKFALLGRVHLRSSAHSGEPEQIAMAVQRGKDSFTLTGGIVPPRIDVRAVARVDVGDPAPAISGTVYRDDDADGDWDAHEPGIANWGIQLLDQNGDPAVLDRAVEPDDFDQQSSGRNGGRGSSPVSTSSVRDCTILTAFDARHSFATRSSLLFHEYGSGSDHSTSRR